MIARIESRIRGQSRPKNDVRLRNIARDTGNHRNRPHPRDEMISHKVVRILRRGIRRRDGPSPTIKSDGLRY